MSRGNLGYVGSGPFLAERLRPGDRYELSDGHAIYCAPTGGDEARCRILGALVLDSDPDVEEAGIDAGYSAGPGELRAPDVAVGNVPDKPGWIQGVPPLALEYAGSGQDEQGLQSKIADLLLAGTRWVWVARLLGPRRVEVYEKGIAVRVVSTGEELLAPGILRNPVPVEALFDRSVAHRVTFRNLLQRQGYKSLEEARREGLTHMLLIVLDARGIEVSEAARAEIMGCCDAALLETWGRRAATSRSIVDVLRPAHREPPPGR